MKKRLLIVGCGDVALRTVRLLAGRYRVYALLRDPGELPRLRACGVVPILGDLDRPATLARLAGIGQLVLHSAPPQPEGTTDRRTANLLAALGRKAMLPYRLVYISTSGVYGDCGGARVAETRPVHPRSARALRRTDAEARLRAWGRSCRVSVAILRVPGIYAAERLPLARLTRGTPALRPEEDVYTSHIHAEDLAAAVLAALARGRPNRVYNCADGSELKMGDYFDRVAGRFGLPRPPRISRSEAAGRVPPALLSFMAESRRLDNTRMLRELRVRLRYPDVDSALREMLSR